MAGLAVVSRRCRGLTPRRIRSAIRGRLEKGQPGPCPNRHNRPPVSPGACSCLIGLSLLYPPFRAAALVRTGTGTGPVLGSRTARCDAAPGVWPLCVGRAGLGRTLVARSWRLAVEERAWWCSRLDDDYSASPHPPFSGVGTVGGVRLGGFSTWWCPTLVGVRLGGVRWLGGVPTWWCLEAWWCGGGLRRGSPRLGSPRLGGSPQAWWCPASWRHRASPHRATAPGFLHIGHLRDTCQCSAVSGVKIETQCVSQFRSTSALSRC